MVLTKFSQGWLQQDEVAKLLMENGVAPGHKLQLSRRAYFHAISRALSSRMAASDEKKIAFAMGAVPAHCWHHLCASLFSSLMGLEILFS